MAERLIKNVYNAGELSPRIDGRTDLAKYYNGCSKLINGIVLPYGGITKRPGTEFISTTKYIVPWLTKLNYALGDIVVEDGVSYICITAHTAGTFATDLVAGRWQEFHAAEDSYSKVKLFEFEFSSSDTMIVEMGNYYARFYQDGATETLLKTDISNWAVDTEYEVNDIIEDNVAGDRYYYCNTAHTSDGVAIADDLAVGRWTLLTEDPDDSDYVIYEIQTPYTSDEVFDIHVTQSADVLYFAHTDFHPRILSRVATNDWTLENMAFTGGPFLVGNTEPGKTLQFTTLAKHDGGDIEAVLSDSSQAWTISEFVGRTIYNITNSESAVITANTATTITGALSGDETWDNDDTYNIDGYFPEGSEGTLEATNHTPFLGTTDDIGVRYLVETTRDDNITSTIDNAGNIAPDDLSNAVKTKGDFTLTAETVTLTKLWRKEGNGGWQEFRSFTASASYSATELFDNVYYAVSASAGTFTFTAKNQTNRGIVEITAEDDTNTATVKVVSEVQQSQAIGDGAVATSVDTTEWAEGAWGEYRGYPVSVGFFENRLWFAGTTNNPKTAWGSVNDQYTNHKTGTLADDAVIVTIQGEGLSSIQWLASRRSLLAGTAKKEYVIRANSVDDPIKPNDVKPFVQSANGSNSIQPVALGEGLFYVQRSGRKVWAMRFSFADEEFKSTDATLLSEHLLTSAPVDMAAQGVPDPIVWVVRDDGVLLSFTYQPEEEVAAWARHATGTMSANLLNGKVSPDALFESVAVIAGSVEDETWVSVQRYIDGATVRYVERFSTRFFDQLDEAQMLDSAITVVSDSDSSDIVMASDTIRFGSGIFGSGTFGA